MSSVLLAVVSLAVCGGCSRLRGYVSREHGQVNLRVKNQMGPGTAVHDYFITPSDDIINVGDSSRRVAYFLGYPSTKDYSMDGYDIWVYPDLEVKFYFSGEILKSIQGTAAETDAGR